MDALAGGGGGFDTKKRTAYLIEVRSAPILGPGWGWP